MPRPRVWRRRGLGDYYTDHCGNDHPLSVLNPFCYAFLDRDVSKVASEIIDSGYPAPPLPTPITTTLVPTGGVDVAGNPTYEVVPQTAQENQAANAAQIKQFFSDVAAANAPDCTAWYNRAFNSDCGGSWLFLAGGLLAIAFVVPAVLNRGRR